MSPTGSFIVVLVVLALCVAAISYHHPALVLLALAVLLYADYRDSATPRIARRRIAAVIGFFVRCALAGVAYAYGFPILAMLLAADGVYHLNEARKQRP